MLCVAVGEMTNCAGGGIMSGSRYVVDFNDALAVKHALVGGKAASLGRLTKAGFPVPPGFTISTEAYSAFMAGLQEQVAVIL